VKHTRRIIALVAVPEQHWRHQAHGNALPAEVGRAMGAERRGDVARAAFAQGHQRLRLGRAGMEPAGRLVDRADVARLGVGVRGQEPDLWVAAQQPDDEAEDAGFAVARQVVGQSEAAQARAVGAHGTSDQTVGVDLAGVEGDGARQACGREHAQRQFHPDRRRMEVMVQLHRGDGEVGVRPMYSFHEAVHPWIAGQPHGPPR
jgi:hypothetical protein